MAFALRDVVIRKKASFFEGAVIGMLLVPSFFIYLCNLKGIDGFSLLIPSGVMCGIANISRFRRIFWYVLNTLVFFVVVIVYTPLVPSLVPKLIRAEKPERADAVVVLGTYVSDEGRISSEGLNRLLYGATLVSKGFASTLIRTTLPDTYPSSIGDVSEVVSILDKGIKMQSVGPASNTREEALIVKEFLRQRGFVRIILVTSPLHSRRAGNAFEKVGISTQVVPSPERDNSLTGLDEPRIRWSTFWTCLYEFTANRSYRIRGWS